MHSTLGAIPNISEKDAARLLITDSALGQLSMEDALKIISYMRPKRIKVGTVFIREGEKVHTDYLILILAGDARVESLSAGATDDQMVVSVIGSGHLLGEIGLISGSARSATCTAASEMAVAVLTRSALKKMMTEQPALSAAFLLAVSSRLADRLRETTQKLKRFIQINNVLQKEVFTLMDAQNITKINPTVSGQSSAFKPDSLAWAANSGSQATSPAVKRSPRSAKTQPVPLS